MKLATQASIDLDEEAEKYRDDLLKRATELAKQDRKPDEVTPSHIDEARIQLRTKPAKPAKFSLRDSLFAVGCVFLGVTITYIIEISSGRSGISPIAIILLGIFSGILLGVGAMGKAKQN